MNLASVHEPAAHDLRHSSAQSTRHTSLWPGSRPPTWNNASFAGTFPRLRGQAYGNPTASRDSTSQPCHDSPGIVGLDPRHDTGRGSEDPHSKRTQRTTALFG